MVTMLQPCGIVCRRTHFIFRRGSCDLFACAVGQKRAVARGAARCHSAAATLPPRPLPLCVRRQPPAIAAAAAATGWGATPPPLATQPQRDIHCTPISASCTFLVVWPNLHTEGEETPDPLLSSLCSLVAAEARCRVGGACASCARLPCCLGSLCPCKSQRPNNPSVITTGRCGTRHLTTSDPAWQLGNTSEPRFTRGVDQIPRLEFPPGDKQLSQEQLPRADFQLSLLFPDLVAFGTKARVFQQGVSSWPASGRHGFVVWVRSLLSQRAPGAPRTAALGRPRLHAPHPPTTPTRLAGGRATPASCRKTALTWLSP